MHQDVQGFIERMGLLMEQDGLPRIAGRIYALMLVSPDACSLDDIAESLGVSKASVSNDARMLERFGLIERVSRPGDRRDYYQVHATSLERTLSVRLERMHQMDHLLEHAAQLPIKHAAVRQRLADHRSAYGVVVAAMQQLLDQLTTKRQLRSKAS
jgi:DNA-binding transcriptional regulator GbsR (MarR family)